ncbi:MAG: hypothetical protein ACXAC5_03685 [Promethearchaeota archaeon]|jgi:hypothetical protein
MNIIEQIQELLTKWEAEWNKMRLEDGSSLYAICTRSYAKELKKRMDELRALVNSVQDEVTPETSAKEDAVKRFGADVVYEAESYYETDFDKEFWRDLDADERLDYIHRARYNMKKDKATSNA